MSLTEEDVDAISNQLRIKARADYASRIPINGLGDSHRQAFHRAISNILATDIAAFAYAQIVDGLPTADEAYSFRWPGIFGDHPIDEHEELCPGALEKAQELCKSWTLDVLLFMPQLVNSFREAKPGSKLYESSLIELVAVALHQFAALVFRLEFHLHKGDIDSVTKWVMPDASYKPRPTLFSLSQYLHDDIYPDGVADMVGYWAEDRILGGVVVFDRKGQTTSNEETTPNVYWHSSRLQVPSRVYQLRDDQQKALVDFLLRDDEGDEDLTPCPLPILGDDGNTVRVDAWNALVIAGLFRDIWERKPPTESQISFEERRPRAGIDYPEDVAQLIKVNAELGIPYPKRKREYNEEDDSEEETSKVRKVVQGEECERSADDERSERKASSQENGL